jgi:hypothetical protein
MMEHPHRLITLWGVTTAAGAEAQKKPQERDN